MPDNDAFDDVPDDILFTLYDLLDYNDKLSLMAVDKRFLGVAQKHRFFWEDLRLGRDPGRDPHPAATGFFLTRLAMAGVRPIMIDITIQDPQYIITKIVAHLFHVRSLALRVDIKHGRTLLDSLQMPAPILRSLSLGIYCTSRTGASVRTLQVMDGNILASHAPLLHSVALFNIALSSPIPPVLLAHVKTFDVGADCASLRLPLILREGGIRRLTLRHNVVLAAGEYADSLTWKSVEELCIDGCRRARAYRFFALRLVPVLQLDFPDHTTTAAALDHLPDHLRVSFRRTETNAFVADVTAAEEPGDGLGPGSRIRRRVRGSLPGRMDAQYSEALQELLLGRTASRISHLEVAIGDWNALLKIKQPLWLPRLTQLTLLFPSPSHAPAVRWASSCIACSRLRRLVLRGRSDVLVDATDIASFAKQLLFGVSFPIALSVEHIAIIDSYALWHGVFAQPEH